MSEAGGSEWREEEIAEFLGTGVVARMSCLDDEGWPTAVPTWFQYRDGGFYLIPRERSAWARYLVAEPRCT
jgi:nitroimidazol reductase NimA-like FMN-containing flavoprotein (pyridoxamine 5'-phosphate oxidase superfamily)